MNNKWGMMLFFSKLSQIQKNKQLNYYKHKDIITVNLKSKKILSDLISFTEKVSGFPYLYKRFFEDMEKFNFLNISSVSDDKDNWSPNIYGEITLYQHTIGTVELFFEIIGKLDIPKSQIDFYFIVILLHDFGKSIALCKFYNIDKFEAHHKRSAEYFIKITEELKIDIDESIKKVIYDTLFNHHESTSKDSMNNPFLYVLIEADKIQREREKKLLEVNNLI